MPNDANIIDNRFFLAIKDEGTGYEVWKARFVVQGYCNVLKTSLVHNSPTAKQSLIKILLVLTTNLKFVILSTDVTQAYLYSAEISIHELYLKTSPESKREESKLLHLNKPLYGLPDSGDYCGRKTKFHLISKF